MTNEAIEAAALLPCPFCGEDCAILNEDIKWAGYQPSCLEVRTGYDSTKNAPWRAEAIAAWNTRAAAPALMKKEGEKAGRRKATKQIADWLREWGEDHLANQIEEGAPFQ